MSSTAAFPLAWPEGFPRTRQRETSRFKTGLSAALDNVRRSLTAFGNDSGNPATEIVISSNVSLGVSKPNDPGVAVWFRWHGDMRCIAVDRYGLVEENLQAIHHVIEARRTELRHGTLAIVKAAMSGLKALPAPAGKHWRAVLEIDGEATADRIREQHRKLAIARHPDKHGGSENAMAELNRARAVALAELG